MSLASDQYSELVWSNRCELDAHIKAGKDENNISFILDWFDCVNATLSGATIAELTILFKAGDWAGIKAACFRAATSIPVEPWGNENGFNDIEFKRPDSQ